MSRSVPSLWGYQTRSYQSAAVMAAVDFFSPGRKDELFHWGDYSIISSIGGLGDLFIQLPLLAGLVKAMEEKRVFFKIALRPEHVEIGRRCGWPVMEFVNPLQTFFARGLSLKAVQDFSRQMRELRQEKIGLWIDLTGNAFNTVGLRMGKVQKIASRITRGGKGWVDCVLPHPPYCNEYLHQKVLADFFRCELDPAIYKKVSSAAQNGKIVLTVTTGSRWRSWPLAYFLEVVNAFPQETFVLVGQMIEIEKNEWEALAKLKAAPNVIDQIDHQTTMELIDAIAGAKAIISNDNGCAHVANAFGIPGCVIFGPSFSQAWASSSGLKLFHDQSCPYYPCAEWKCHQPEEWCMKKMGSQEVIRHLVSLFSSNR